MIGARLVNEIPDYRQQSLRRCQVESRSLVAANVTLEQRVIAAQQSAWKPQVLNKAALKAVGSIAT